MAWERDELRAAVEAMLFASDAPVSVETLVDVLPRADEKMVRACIGDLKEAYESADGGLQIVQVAGGYHIRTRPELAHWVERLLRKRRKMRLSQAALETLAIIAYKQPVTRMEVESIRGVDVGGVLGTLLERDLITIKGRSRGPGRPLLYRTTTEFLDHFGLNDLDDLPSLEELESLLAKRDEQAAEDVPVGEDHAPGGEDDEKPDAAGESANAEPASEGDFENETTRLSDGDERTAEPGATLTDDAAGVSGKESDPADDPHGKRVEG